MPFLKHGREDTPGMRVEVVFGNKEICRHSKGASMEKPADFEPKEILNILDIEPVVNKTNWSSGDGSPITICAAKEK